MFYHGDKCPSGVYRLCPKWKKVNEMKKMELFGPHHIDVLSLLFGTLLGNSYGEKRAGKCRIVLQQENSNQEYLFGVHNFLSSRGYCNIEKPKQEKRIGKKNKVRFFSRIRTYSFASFNWLQESFYQNKLKCIPRKELLEQYLTPLALAVWISDDGTAASGGGVSIATNCFSKEDILMVCEVLNDKYGLLSNPQKTGFSKKNRKQQYSLYIWKRSVPILITILSPLMVPSMRRKLHVKA
jgi:ubiquinol-cytochrome c reductase cytochrome b subunit